MTSLYEGRCEIPPMVPHIKTPVDEKQNLPSLHVCPVLFDNVIQRTQPKIAPRVTSVWQYAPVIETFPVKKIVVIYTIEICIVITLDCIYREILCMTSESRYILDSYGVMHNYVPEPFVDYVLWYSCCFWAWCVHVPEEKVLVLFFRDDVPVFLPYRVIPKRV